MALDDAAVFEGGVTVGNVVEDDGVNITEGSAKGVDVNIAAGGTILGVEVGVTEDAVVDGSNGVDVLEVEGIAAGGELGTSWVVTAGGFTARGVVDDTGTSGVVKGELL